MSLKMSMQLALGQCSSNLCQGEYRSPIIDHISNFQQHGDAAPKFELYSVKSCYDQLARALRESNPVMETEAIYADLWKTEAPSKVIIFRWKMFLSAVPTRTLLL